MADDHSFIPEPWSSTDDPALDWLYNTGSVAQALAYSELFWPHFTKHDDCIFLRFDLEKYEAWMAELDGNKSRVEATINHRHIADVFENTASVVSHDWLIALGRTLKQCWAAKLRVDFPKRRFEVQFDEEPSADLDLYQITFYQPR